MTTVKYGRRGEGSLCKTDNGFWYSVLSVNGRQVEFSTKCTNLRDARLFHKAKLEELVLAKHGKGEFASPALLKLRFGSLLNDRVADYQLNGGRDLGSFLSHVKPVRAHFGEHRAVDIKAKAIDAFVLQRKQEGYAAGSINRELGIISSTLRLALERGQLAKVPTVRRLPEHNVRTGFFERHEVEAVICHLPEHLKDLVRMAYLCGWRFGELVSLRWSDVDLPSRTIRLRAEESKNGQARLLALEGELWDLVQRRLAARLLPTLLDRIKVSSLVFHHRGGKPVVRIDSSWASACQRAAIPGRHFHDLRRSAVRNMIRSGVSETVAMRISGHRTRAMLDRYDITSEQDLRVAAQKIDMYVDTLPVAHE